MTSSMTSIKHVGVVGAGQMGRGITEVCARAACASPCAT